MARFDACPEGHTKSRDRWGHCRRCRGAGKSERKWFDPLATEPRAAAWAAYCERIDAAIAETRRREGFDGRVTPWQTFTAPLLRPTARLPRTRPEWTDGKIHCRRCGAIWDGGMCCYATPMAKAAS